MITAKDWKDGAAQLLGIAEAPDKLRTYFLSGDVYDAVLIPELSRIRDQLGALPTARDKPQALREIASALQAIHHLLTPQYAGKGIGLMGGTQMRLARLAWTDHFTLFLLACVFAVLGDKRAALEAIDSAMAIDPTDHVGTHLAKSNLLWDFSETTRELNTLTGTSLSWVWPPYRRLDLSKVRREFLRALPIAPELPGAAPQAPVVFVSYAREDQEVVELICSSLTAAGFSVWLDRSRLVAGDVWRSEVERAIDSAHFAVPFLSRQSVQKIGFFQSELKRLLDRQKHHPEGLAFVIPVRLDECEVPPSLQPYHWLDAFPDFAAGAARLRDELRKQWSRRTNHAG